MSPCRAVAHAALPRVQSADPVQPKADAVKDSRQLARWTRCSGGERWPFQRLLRNANDRRDRQIVGGSLDRDKLRQQAEYPFGGCRLIGYAIIPVLEPGVHKAFATKLLHDGYEIGIFMHRLQYWTSFAYSLAGGI